MTVPVELDLRAPIEDGFLEPSLVETNAQAAEVCFELKHTSPVRLTVVLDGAVNSDPFEVHWKELSASQRRSHRNVLNAIEHGAYGVALAIMRRLLDLRGYSRADHGSGADYYVIPAGEDDLENAIRLEVRGTDTAEMYEVNRGVHDKVQQLKRGKSNLPGMACVVGFTLTTVKLQAVLRA